MSKKNWLLVAFLAALAVAYVVWFTDWFRGGSVRISLISRQLQRQSRPGMAEPAPVFILGRQLQLTEIAVVPLVAWQTNHDVLPLWHLVSASNSVPVKSFPYGKRIPGMKLAVAGSSAKPLDPQTAYRITVATGKIKGQMDFRLDGEPAQAK